MAIYSFWITRYHAWAANLLLMIDQILMPPHFTQDMLDEMKNPLSIHVNQIKTLFTTRIHFPPKSSFMCIEEVRFLCALACLKRLWHQDETANGIDQVLNAKFGDDWLISLLRRSGVLYPAPLTVSYLQRLHQVELRITRIFDQYTGSGIFGTNSNLTVPGSSSA